MSEKRYIKNCKQCGKEFVSRSKKGEFDSTSCRSKYHRSQHDSFVETQAKVIKTQAQVINAVLPKTKTDAAVQQLSYKRDYDEVQKVIREINFMVREAKERAANAGDIEERWSPYVKDSSRFQQLCRMIQNSLK
jgi:hypothetical protein